MEASFTASAVLAVAGGASLRVATKKQRILAIVPFLFAIQQFLEGVQWMYLNQGSVCRSAGYGFLFFALVVWPIIIPVIIYVMDKPRRWLTGYFVVGGALVSLWSVYMLFTRPLIIAVVGQHIFYNPPGAFDGSLYFLSYIIVVVGSALISSKKGFRIHGLLGIVSAIMTILISTHTSASVWCFFGAIISVWIYFNLKYKFL